MKVLVGIFFFALVQIISMSATAETFYQCGCALPDGSSWGFAEYDNVSYDQAMKKQKKWCGDSLWEMPGTKFESREECTEVGNQSAHCELMNAKPLDLKKFRQIFGIKMKNSKFDCCYCVGGGMAGKPGSLWPVKGKIGQCDVSLDDGGDSFYENRVTTEPLELQDGESCEQGARRLCHEYAGAYVD